MARQLDRALDTVRAAKADGVRPVAFDGAVRRVPAAELRPPAKAPVVVF